MRKAWVRYHLTLPGADSFSCGCYQAFSFPCFWEESLGTRLGIRLGPLHVQRSLSLPDKSENLLWHNSQQLILGVRPPTEVLISNGKWKLSHGEVRKNNTCKGIDLLSLVPSHTCMVWVWGWPSAHPTSRSLYNLLVNHCVPQWHRLWLTTPLPNLPGSRSNMVSSACL